MNNEDSKQEVQPQGPKEFDGILWPPMVPGNVKDQLDGIREMEIRSDDIIISTFPRSGTHWIGDIVTMLINGSAEYQKEMYTSSMLESNSVETFKEFESPRILYTHLPHKYIPKNLDKARVIYVARNPKDVAVSLHCIQISNKAMLYHNDWNKFIEGYMKGKGVPFGGWFDNVIPWVNWCNECNNALFLKFEDLKRNLKDGIRQVAKFIGVKADEKLIEEMAAALDFKAVKAKRDKDMAEHTKLMTNTAGNNFFYRKGQVADCKNWFTVAQNEQFDQLYEDKMKDTGLKFDFVL